ncbi:hypothetical protein JHK85_024568 [Glycine max]|nr:hypothetical protein JHK85_024568 [Glycine max]
MTEMEETVSRVISELEDLRGNPQPPPLSEQTLTNLLFLLKHSLSESLYDELSSKNLSPSSLIPPIASAMDSSPPHHSLLASDVFLSLLLAPNAPVFTLFTPMSFLSFLRSLRRSCKAHSHPGPAQDNSQNGKRKRPGRGRAKNPQNEDDSPDTSSQHDPRVLLRVLEKLVEVMGLIHLNRFPETLKSLIQTVAEIPVTSLNTCGNAAVYSRLLSLCSHVLKEVLKSEHGEPSNTAAEVLKSLCSLVLMAKSQARTFALGFVTSLGNQCDDVKKALVNFPRYLAKKAPEKAEPRALAVESIMEVVKVMGFDDQIAFVKYVVQMAQGKSSLRLLAVDLILNLVMSLKDPLGVESEESEVWGIWCLEVLLKRCSDVSGAIRARALSNLAQLVGFLSRGERTSVVLKEFMGFGKVGDGNVEGGMNDMLRRRCMDDKAAVRKAALLLVTNLTSLLGGAIDEVVLKTMGMACSDPLISMRKAAITALSEAFRTFSAETVITEWLHSVPRLISDNESSIQEECENMFKELVLDRIIRAATATSSYSEPLSNRKMKGKGLDNEMEMFFPNGTLYLLREICHGEVSPWVKKICTNLGKKNRINHKIVTALQNIIRVSESIWLSHSMPIEKWTAPPGAWFLLSEVSTFLSKVVDWEFLHHHWQLLDKHEVEGEFKSPFVQRNASEEEESIECNHVAWASDRVFLLQTISNVSVELPPVPAADLAHNLLKRVEQFNMHSTEVDAHLKALKTLCKRKASNLEEAEALVLKWVHQVLSRASGIIEKFISENSEQNAEGSFFTPPRSGTSKGRKSVAKSKSLSKAVTAIYTVGSVVIVCPSADMSNLVPLLHTIITSGSSGPKLNNLPSPSTSLQQEAPSFYIQGWLAMGKLCLADGKLAKNYIPLFVQELEKSKSAALRNNIVVMMADFCVRFTALVDWGTDEESRSKRMHIYVSLLKQMAPEHLLATFAKLCAEILAAASDGMLNIEDATGQSVLQDAFQILGCKEIRISSTRASSESADVEEEGGESGSAARGKTITQAVKKGLIQNTVPIFIELKRLLETKNSPLIGSLMECLRIILKDYKNEIDDILVADKQLQKELIYDIKKYEAAKAKATVAEAVGTKPKSVSNQSPDASKNLTKTQGQTVGQSSNELPSDSRVASAMANAAAAATARSVLREINKGTATPSLSSLSVPKVKSCTGMCHSKDKRMDVIQSIRKRQSFDSDEEN